MAKSKIHEQLDAFRPGHDDGELPELADAAASLREDAPLRESFDRSQQLDRSIQNAMDEVPVPPELALRLQQALGIALEPPTAEDSSTAEDASDPTGEDRKQESLDAADAGVTSIEPSVTSTSRMAWRRRWLTVGVSTAAAALIGFAILMLQPPTPPPLTGAELAQQIDDLAGQWSNQIFDWQTTSPPTTHPVHPAVKMGGASWRRAEVLGDSAGVIYRKGKVLLIVARGTSVGPVGGNPPLPPQGNTGSRRIGVWSSNLSEVDHLVYVLVVAGDLAAYESMLRVPDAA